MEVECSIFGFGFSTNNSFSHNHYKIPNHLLKPMEIAHIVKCMFVVGTLMKDKEAKLSGNESTSKSQHQGGPPNKKTNVGILSQLAYRFSI